MKLKAGTLFFVLLISLLIGIIMTSLVMFAFYTRQKNNDDLVYLRLQTNVESAYTYIQAGCVIAERDTSYSLDLYGQEEDSVKVSLQPWGIFQIASVSAFHHTRSVSKSSILGYLPPDSNITLGLSKRQRDFTLSGDSRIYGNAVLPSRFINRGNAERRNYSGDKMIYSGVIREGDAFLGKRPDERLLKNIKQDLSSLRSLTAKALLIESDTLKYEVSFQLPTLYLKPKGQRLPDGIALSGNVVLCSDTVIRIPASCRLGDIIIMAPAVIFEERFTGSLQVFCTDSIITGNECRFTYPSVFGLIKNSFSIKVPHIQTGENNRIEGLLFSIHEVQDLDGSLLSIGKKNKYTGIIYTQGQLELKEGTEVKGNVTAAELILHTNSSRYSNNLLDVSINRILLPEYFAGTILPPVSSRLAIVKWLH